MKKIQTVIGYSFISNLKCALPEHLRRRGGEQNMSCLSMGGGGHIECELPEYLGDMGGVGGCFM